MRVTNNVTTEQQFRRNLSRYRLFIDPKPTVVVAVSTGVDSMVLLHLMNEFISQHGGKLIVAHVNHELRTQSEDEETFLRDTCARLNIKLLVEHWPKKDHPNHGVENAARRIRYRFFQRVMKENDAQYLMTAHHQNDLAETILMKLVRGGQLDQLTGIQWSRKFGSGELLRPLLNISKQQLKQYAISKKIVWYEDVTNSDLVIQRNRFRHQIIPALQRENVAFLDHISDYREQLSAVNDLANQRIDEVIDNAQTSYGLFIPAIRSESHEQLQLILRRWLEHDQNIIDLNADQLRQIAQMIENTQKPQTDYDLGDGIQISKRYNTLRIGQKNVEQHFIANVQEHAHVLELGKWYRFGNEMSFGAFEIDDNMLNIADQTTDFWLPESCLPLLARTWDSKDRIRLKNGHHQLVRRVLVDHKVDLEQRRLQPVVVDSQKHVLWVPGLKKTWLERPSDYVQKWHHLVFGIMKAQQEETINE